MNLLITGANGFIGRALISRLLSERTPGERACLICGKYEGRAVPAWAGFPRPPGGHLIDDGSPAATCAARRWR